MLEVYLPCNSAIKHYSLKCARTTFSLDIGFIGLTSGACVVAAFVLLVLTRKSGLPQLFCAGHHTGMAQVKPRQLITFVIPATEQDRNEELQDRAGVILQLLTSGVLCRGSCGWVGEPFFMPWEAHGSLWVVSCRRRAFPLSNALFPLTW